MLTWVVQFQPEAGDFPDASDQIGKREKTKNRQNCKFFQQNLDGFCPRA